MVIIIYKGIVNQGKVNNGNRQLSKQMDGCRAQFFIIADMIKQSWFFSALMSEILSKIEHALLIRNGGLADF